MSVFLALSAALLAVMTWFEEQQVGELQDAARQAHELSGTLDLDCLVHSAGPQGSTLHVQCESATVDAVTDELTGKDLGPRFTEVVVTASDGRARCPLPLTDGERRCRRL